MQAWSFHGNVEGNVKSGSYLVHMVRDRVEKDGKIVDAGGVDKRKVIYEPEFSRLLKDMERRESDLSEVARQSFDEPFLYNGAKTSEERSTHPHIAWVSMTTRADLGRYLSDTSISNGLANRYLFVWSEMTAATATGSIPDALAEVAVRLRSALARWTSDGDDGQFELSPKALILWNSIAPGFDYVVDETLVGSMNAQTSFHVLKLALIYAVADGEHVVGVDHLVAALALRHYSGNVLLYIFGTAAGSSDAQSLLKGFVDAPDGIMTLDQLHNLMGRNLPAVRVRAAVDLLVRLGRIGPHQLQAKRGRPAKAWKLAPNDGVSSFLSFSPYLSRLRESAMNAPRGAIGSTGQKSRASGRQRRLIKGGSEINEEKASPIPSASNERNERNEENGKADHVGSTGRVRIKL